MSKILVSDPLSDEGLDILRESGFPVDVKTGLTEDELCKIIGEYECLIVRSGTRVTKKVIDAGDKLRVIGRAGVGVDNIDIPAATEKGILVMNTPSANILSAAEHTCAMLLALARNIPFAHVSMHRGEWKRAEYTGVELAGKTLGIIGVGRVGGEVAKRMKVFGMTMIGYDPFLPKDVADGIGVRLTTLEEVLSKSDFMTIHTPLLPDTRNMISTEEFNAMKPNARFVNVARGGVVDEEALYVALKNNVIAGAAFDVWCEEPLCESEQKLLDLENLITTPHLGASTVEAQERVATEIAEAAIKFLKDGIITNAINAPRGKLDPETELYVPLAERMGVLAHQLNGNMPIKELEIVYSGDLANKDTKILTIYVVMGVLRNIIGPGRANMINAMAIAKGKGIQIKVTSTAEAKDYRNVIEVKTAVDGTTRSIRGTVFGGQPRLVGIDKYSFEVPMSGDMVYVRYKDAPGMIGKIGTAMGEAKINIAQMAVGRTDKDAMMVLIVDQDVDANVLKNVVKVSGAADAKFIDLVEN